MTCRFCKNPQLNNFLDLACAPPSNAYLTADRLNASEVYYPLNVKVCSHCWLVQTEDYNAADQLFDDDYAYFSSTSSSWLDHAKRYCDMITDRLNLNDKSLVVELASNDGYLLKNFVAKNIPCLGIEPTKSTADAAKAINVPTLQKFFGEDTATDLAKDQKADLMIGNNVYAHVPNIRDFTMGIKTLLTDNGTVTLEFPHLLQLLQLNQFDTVYHEHYSYLSAIAVQTIFAECGLKIYDIEKIPTHGGSLRIFGTHLDNDIAVTDNVHNVLAEEKTFGLNTTEPYTNFQNKADRVKNDFLAFLLQAKKDGKSVVGYGAAAKGNTLMNYAGIKTDLIQYVCDAAPSKQNKFMPGSRLPIVKPDQIKTTKPDYVIILPWNIRDEVMTQLSYIKEWGGQFVTFIPETKIV